MLRLYVVENRAVWGHSVTVVAAESDGEAKTLAYPRVHPESLDVMQVLDIPTEPRAVWCYEEEADSAPDDD